MTLPNGERIQFGKNVNFLFETVDLKHASPATISRMGVIFLSPEDVNENEIVKHRIRHETQFSDVATVQKIFHIMEKMLSNRLMSQLFR